MHEEKNRTQVKVDKPQLVAIDRKSKQTINRIKT